MVDATTQCPLLLGGEQRYLVDLLEVRLETAFS